MPTIDVLPRGGGASPANLAAAAVALANGLQLAIRALAEQNGNKPGPWLDDLEAASLRDAKGSSATGIDMKVEADAVQYGHDVIKALFEAERLRLSK